MDNIAADYQNITELDRYDSSMLDDRQYAGMTLEERKRAEEENARRAARSAGLEELLADDGEEDDERKQQRRERFQRSGAQDIDMGPDGEAVEEESDIEQEDELDLKALDQVPLREFLAQDKTRRIINKKVRAASSEALIGVQKISPSQLVAPRLARFALKQISSGSSSPPSPLLAALAVTSTRLGAIPTTQTLTPLPAKGRSALRTPPLSTNPASHACAPQTSPLSRSPSYTCRRTSPSLPSF